MQSLLTVILAWLAINFGLPAADEPPRVAFVSPAAMADVRHDRLASSAPGGAGRSAPPESFPGVHAIYDDRSRTIHLPEGWTAGSPADVSMLVHELVHHLQNVGDVRHGCPQARERLAYQAQAHWLELFGTSLEAEFGIDRMTVLVRTTCVN